MSETEESAPIDRTTWRYALFVDMKIYPSPAWKSFVAAYRTLEEATRIGSEMAAQLSRGWYQVVDLDCFAIVAEDYD